MTLEHGAGGLILQASRSSDVDHVPILAHRWAPRSPRRRYAGAMRKRRSQLRSECCLGLSGYRHRRVSPSIGRDQAKPRPHFTIFTSTRARPPRPPTGCRVGFPVSVEPISRHMQQTLIDSELRFRQSAIASRDPLVTMLCSLA